MKQSLSETGRTLRGTALALALALAVTTAGCEILGQAIAVWIAPRHPKKTVEAEYELEAKRLVIVPYAGNDVLFEYPTAPLQVSRDLVHELVGHLGTRIGEIVHPVQVARWQESNLEWPNMSLEAIAETFQADVLLYVELEQYTMLETGSPNLLRGQVRARVQVVEADAEANPAYESIVQTRFPEQRPVAEGEVSPRRIRAVVTRLFARDLVRRFYDHEVPLEGEGVG
ncbi:MAG: hypothetical protein R6X20_05615 [Phycisphaerae bacterium]